MKYLFQPTQTLFRVRYAECDPARVAHHSSYLLWFEAGRADLCRERGLDYWEMEQNGLFLPVVELQCRYLMSARYDQNLLLLTTITEMRRRAVRFAYKIYFGQTLLAEAETYQLLVDVNGAPRTWPPHLLQLLTASGTGSQS